MPRTTTCDESVRVFSESDCAAERGANASQTCEERAAPETALARGGLLELLVGDVEVGPDVLGVVAFLEGVDELQHLLGLLPLERDRRVGVFSELRFFGLGAGLLHGLENRLVCVRRR